MYLDTGKKKGRTSGCACGKATRTPWPLPHEILNSERIHQILCARAELHFQLHDAAQLQDVNIEGKSYK